MTIFSDDVLMLNAAEIEEWYEQELIRRSEFELRQKRVQGVGTPTPSLAGIVGAVPANYNMFVSRAGQYTNFSDSSPYSTFFGNSNAYGFSNASVGQPLLLAPDASLTGQHLIEDNTNNPHYVFPFPQGTNYNGTIMKDVNGQIFRCACIVQAAERTRIVLLATAWDINGMNPLTGSAGFDLAGGNTGYDNVGSSGFTILNTSIRQLPGPGNWWLCILDLQSTTPHPGNQGYTKFSCWIQLDAGSGTAARNTTYQGDGKSGVNVWYFNVLPRGAWPGFGLNNQVVFFDDFITSGTIDLQDLGDPTKTWFIHADWPNNSEFKQGNSTWFRSSVALPPKNITVANSVLTISSGVTGGSRHDFSSTRYSTTSPSGFVGSVFQIPALFEFNMNFNASIVNAVALWTAAIEELVGSVPAGKNYIEIDFTEIGSPFAVIQGTFSLLSWPIQVAPSSTGESFALDTGNGGGIVVPNGPTGFHVYSQLLLPMASNGGVWGTAWNFFDYLFNISGDFLWSATQSYIRAPANIIPPGTFLEVESQHFNIFIGPGQSPADAISVDWVRVYQ